MSDEALQCAGTLEEYVPQAGETVQEIWVTLGATYCKQVEGDIIPKQADTESR
jgi:hypothetical protein